MKGSIAFTLIACGIACLVLHAKDMLTLDRGPAVGSGPCMMRLGVGAAPRMPCGGLVDDFGFPIPSRVALDPEPSRFI